MVFRLQPALSPQFMKTYQILAPKSSHFRDAFCSDVDCPAYEQGWRTSVDEGSELGASQAHYIRSQSGRRYVEHWEESGLTVFEFEAGQRCFVQHKTRLDRPSMFLVRTGDHRGYTSEPRIHHDADDWVDDFATHQATLADQLEKG